MNGGDCDVDSPPPSCTASGGARHKLRYTLRSGVQVSFMVFWKPSSVPAAVPDDVAGKAVSDCAPNAGDNDSDMVVIVTCLKSRLAGALAVLCVKDGMDYSVQPSGVFATQSVTQYMQRDVGYGPAARVDGPWVNIVILS